MILSILTSRLAGPILGVAMLIAALGWGQAGCSNTKLRKAVEEAYQARDDALRDLGQCRANRASLEASQAAQSAAVAAQAAEGDRRLAEARKALESASKAREAAQAKAAKLMRPPEGSNACERMASADEAVLGSLK